MTIDDLAIMIGNSFRDIDRRFDEQRQYMDKRFNAVERDIKDVKNTVELIERKQNAQQDMLDTHSRKLTELSKSS